MYNNCTCIIAVIMAIGTVYFYFNYKKNSKFLLTKNCNIKLNVSEYILIFVTPCFLCFSMTFYSGNIVFVLAVLSISCSFFNQRNSRIVNTIYHYKDNTIFTINKHYDVTNYSFIMKEEYSIGYFRILAKDYKNNKSKILFCNSDLYNVIQQLYLI